MHHRCAHCMTAEKALKNDLGKTVILKDAEEVHLHHKNVRGFPFFFNSDNGMVSLGWPGSRDKLFQALKYSDPSTIANMYYGSAMGTYDGSGSGTYDGSGSGTYDGSGSGTYDGSGSGTYNGSGSSTYDGSGIGVYDGSGSGSGSGSGTYNGSGTGSGMNSGKIPIHPHHFVRMCPQSRGGYLRLGETWSDRTRYIA